MTSRAVELDALIFGGGAAGLWLLDELRRRRFSVLLVESHALGAGQSIASQGILHGGLKYSLRGLISGSTEGVREMPDLWRACLTGEHQPDLREVRVLSPRCYLWRTDSITSRLGMIGAKIGLRTPVGVVPRANRPDGLRECPGEVLQVAESVIDVPSLLQTLGDRHAAYTLRAWDRCDLAYTLRGAEGVDEVRIRNPQTDETITLRPRNVVLTAGEGNESLRRAFGLPAQEMQRRPLHMVMARGALPPLFGHCVDGDKTRVTITSPVDSQGRTVWHVGGELAERGVEMDATDLIPHARRELAAVLPGVDFRGAEWAAYRIDRAEGRARDGKRPEGPVWRRDGNVISAWPTKLVLVPQLARLVADGLGEPQVGDAGFRADFDSPRPAVAQPPWEAPQSWHS